MPHKFLRTAAVAATVAATVMTLAVGGPAAALPATGPTAFVRVEGAGATLLPQTLIHTQTGTTVKGQKCSATSTAGALDAATNGLWSGSYNTKFSDYLVSSILGETPTGNNFWTLFVNGRASSTGACSTALNSDDHVLWFDCQADASFNCMNNPLALSAPAIVKRGQRVTVHVTQIDGAGHSTPVTDAAVGGQGVTGLSGAGGTATITPSSTGVITVQATKGGATPSDPVFMCVYAQSRGDCGRAGGGPAVRITSIKQHAVFRRAHGPRELKGTAGPDPAGLTDVSFWLTRKTAAKHCSYYDADRGRFRSIGCGAIPPQFSLGASGNWSYLLPSRLGSGRYVLEVTATDGADRKASLVEGRSLVTFTVR